MLTCTVCRKTTNAHYLDAQSVGWRSYWFYSQQAGCEKEYRVCPDCEHTPGAAYQAAHAEHLKRQRNR